MGGRRLSGCSRTRSATDRAQVQTGAAPPLGPPVLPHLLAETEKSKALAEQNDPLSHLPTAGGEDTPPPIT